VPEWELLKIKELAGLLQLNQQTVRNMVNRGELEYVKLGRTKYIPRAAAAKLAGGTGGEIPELLTVAQVAELLRLNRQTIWNWIDAGTFPAVQIGARRYRIKRRDLNDWLDARPYSSAKEF
jgi:prophage regulatory protein